MLLLHYGILCRKICYLVHALLLSWANSKLISSHLTSVVSDLLALDNGPALFWISLSLSACVFAGVFWWLDAICSCTSRLGRPLHRLRVRNRTLNPHSFIHSFITRTF